MIFESEDNDNESNSVNVSLDLAIFAGLSVSKSRFKSLKSNSASREFSRVGCFGVVVVKSRFGVSKVGLFGSTENSFLDVVLSNGNKSISSLVEAAGFWILSVGDWVLSNDKSKSKSISGLLFLDVDV